MSQVRATITLHANYIRNNLNVPLADVRITRVIVAVNKISLNTTNQTAALTSWSNEVPMSLSGNIYIANLSLDPLSTYEVRVTVFNAAGQRASERHFIRTNDPINYVSMEYQIRSGQNVLPNAIVTLESDALTRRFTHGLLVGNPPAFVPAPQTPGELFNFITKEETVNIRKSSDNNGNVYFSNLLPNTEYWIKIEHQGFVTRTAAIRMTTVDTSGNWELTPV